MKKLEKLALEKSSQELAGFTHGILFGLHILGAYYNLRRGRKIGALIHTSIALYDAVSLYRHSKYVSDDELLERLRESGL
tara:strand:- start:162 stop:401 length:240 start_codon:yes stop_codon:yes gene_type:complete